MAMETASLAAAEVIYPQLSYNRERQQKGPAESFEEKHPDMDENDIDQKSSVTEKKHPEEEVTYGGKSAATLKKAADYMQGVANSFDRKIQYAVDEDIDRILVKVLDRDSGEVIREIPPKEFVYLLRQVVDFAGLLLNEVA